MLIIIIAIFTILICITLSVKIDYTSKLFLLSFQIIWLLVLSVSTFQPYDLFLPTYFTYFLLITNVCCFSLGFFVIKIHSRNRISTKQIDDLALKILKNHTFRILLLIAGLISLYYYSIVQVVLQATGNLAEIRAEFYSGELLGPSYNVLNGIFLQPMLIICYPLLGFALYYKNWMVIPLFFFMILINSLAGGRFGYVKIFYALIFFFGCVKHLNKKKIIGLSLGAVTLFFALSYITASRNDATGSISNRIATGVDETLEHITTYACGAVVALDYSIENDYVKQIGGHTYGAVTGSSIVQIAYIICNKIGVPFSQPFEPLVKIKQDRYIQVGHSQNFNALYTAVLYFYTDFGVIGVIIIPFILGLLCRLFIKIFLRYENLPSLMLITYCYILLLFSITDFNFTSYSSLFMVILLYWLGTRKTKRNRLSMERTI